MTGAPLLHNQVWTVHAGLMQRCLREPSETMCTMRLRSTGSMNRAGATVPKDLQFSTKGQIAMQQIRRLMAQGAPRHCVPTDAGHGVDTQEPMKYWLSTLGEDMPMQRMVVEAKMRWRIERDCQDLKQDLGAGAWSA